MRGLSAWLAAHCEDARSALIERDPIGVGLYGDIREFSTDLQNRLEQLAIDAQPEGWYANDKRSDIRVYFEGSNVPVEIKKNSHQKLWSALRDQLIAKYTSTPGTDGYGIYLAFWFGKDRTQPPPSGTRPANAEELKNRLEATLSPAEARKISVCVIDVSRPD